MFRAPELRRRAVRGLAAGLVCVTAALSATLSATGRVDADAAPGSEGAARAGLELLDTLRGASGKLKAAFRTPGAPLIPEPPPGLRARYVPARGTAVISPEFEAPGLPGVYSIEVEAEAVRRSVEELRVITLVPFEAKRQGQIGTYRLGQWPFERGGAPSPAYANPAGFVEVTPENVGLPVSAHFRLGDFLTKDQAAVWPKYLLLDAGLVDKLELLIDELEHAGCPVRHLAIMSGFRTPRYNRGGGETSGRATLSRHMYGDATDVFVDNDRDGWTDDVNRDGRVDIHDAQFMAEAAERAEARHPALVGGVGIYPATGAHGPFTHVDVRGQKARWRGGSGR